MELFDGAGNNQQSQEEFDTILGYPQKKIEEKMNKIDSNTEAGSLDILMSTNAGVNQSILQGEEPSPELAAKQFGRFFEGDIGQEQKALAETDKGFLLQAIDKQTQTEVSEAIANNDAKGAVNIIQDGESAYNNLSAKPVTQHDYENTAIENLSEVPLHLRGNYLVNKYRFVRGSAKFEKMMADGVGPRDLLRAQRQIEKEMKQAEQWEGTGVIEPWYSPPDLLADILTAGAGRAVNLAIREGIPAALRFISTVGLKKTAAVEVFSEAEAKSLQKFLARSTGKTLFKETGEDVILGSIAGGCMTAAEWSQSSKTVTALSGLIGPFAVTTLASMGRVGLRNSMKLYRENNKELWSTIKDIAGKGRTPFAKELNLAIKEAEGTSLTVVPTPVIAKSPMATMVDAASEMEDNIAQGKFTNAIVAASLDPTKNSPLTKTIEKASGTGDFFQLLGVVKSPPVPKCFGELARELNNANTLAESLQQHVLQGVLHDKQESVRDRLMLTTTGREYNFGDINQRWAPGMVGKAKAFFASTGTVMKTLGKINDLVLLPTAQLNQENRLNKAFKAAQKEAFRGMSKSQRAKIFDVLDRVNQTGKKIKVVNGGVEVNKTFTPMSLEEIDSLYSQRMILDHAYNLTNQSAIKQAKLNGYKWDEELGLVKPTKGHRIGDTDDMGKIWTKERMQNGDYWIKTVGKDGGKSVIVEAQEAPKRLRNILDTDKLVDYNKDYVPILYKDKFRVIKLTQGKKPNEVKAESIGTASTRKQADDYITKLDSNDEAGVNYLYMRMDGDMAQASIDKNFMTSLYNMNSGEIKLLQQQLQKAGVDASALDGILNTIKSGSFKKASFIKERSVRRLGDTLAMKDGKWVMEGVAPMVPAEEAIMTYLQRVSKYSSFAELSTVLKQKFINTYGEYLLESKRRGVDWLNPPDPAKVKDNDLKREIEVVQDQLRRIFNMSSRAEEEHLQNMASRAERLWGFGTQDITKGPISASKRLTARFMARGLDKFGFNVYGLAKGVKGLSAQAYLGMFNFSQYIVQSTAVLNTVGKYSLDGLATGRNPAINGARDFMKATVEGMGFSKLGKVSEEAEYLAGLMERSGFMSGINYANLHDTFNGWFGLKGLRNKIMDMGSIAYRHGEATQRGVAWFAERRAMIEEIKKGVSQFKMKDIDSDSFLLAITNRASKLSLNMSKFNQPRFARGLLGVPFQFMQFATHQGELMFGKSLTRTQKLGLWGTWAGTFGLTGIPFFWDTATVYETLYAGKENPEDINAVQNFTKDLSKELASWSKKIGLEKDAKFWERFVKKGAISAFSDGEIDIAHRAGIGMMLQGYYDGLSPEDLLGPGFLVISEMIKAGDEVQWRVGEILQDADKLTAANIYNIAQAAARPSSGITHLMQAAEALHTGKLVGKDARLIDSEPSLDEILLHAVGITPGKYIESYEKKDYIYKLDRAWKDWMTKESDRIAVQMSEDPEMANKNLLSACTQIIDNNPTRLKEFYQEVMWKIMSKNLDVETQTMMLNIRKMDPLNLYGE